MVDRPVYYNSITFNVAAVPDAGMSQSPYYWLRITDADGLFGDEVRTETHPIPCDIGERHGNVLRSGKQIVLTGEVYGLNAARLQDGVWALQGAFWDLQEHKLEWEPWTFVVNGTATDKLYWMAYVNQPLVITDVIDGMSHHMRKWTVGLRADNPRSRKSSDDTVYPTFQS